MTAGGFETVELLDLEMLPSPGLSDWLREQHIVVGFSHTNKIVAVGPAPPDGDPTRLTCSTAEFDRVTALALDPQGRLWVGADHELWTLTNGVPPGSQSRTGADLQLLPRTARVIGRVRPADVAFLADGSPVFCSVTLSCVAVPHRQLSVVPVWAPPWITELTPETRCRLSGLAVVDGELAAVTAASTSDTPDGWRADLVAGGVVVDPRTDEIVLRGIGLPHSPRWHDGHLWVLSSATGELGRVSGGRFEPVARLDGYARGMTIVDRWALVGLSGSRWDELVAGLPLGDRLAAAGRRPESGVAVVDLTSGEVVHRLLLEGTAREISDVVAHRGVTSVDYERAEGRVAQHLVTVPTDPVR